MMVPFSAIVMWTFREKIENSWKKILWRGGKIAFIFSISIKSLQQSGAQLTNIVVTDNNIKSFDRVARKYGIDYSLKKAEKEGKTEYLVFFKAKDVDVMTAAFKEYTGVSLKKEQRQSIRKKLEQAKERVAKHREITKEKTKDRGQVR